MKQIIKYIISIILLILFTVIIVMFPKIYFKKYDNNDKDNFKINPLNLTNIYQNNSLSNTEILRLLNDSSNNDVRFVIETDISKNEYLNIMQNIEIELNKINLDCYKTFINNFDFNYEDIKLIANKIYLTNSKKESTILISLTCFHNDNSGFYVLLDNNKHTLFDMNAWNDLGEDSTTDIIDDYVKYLDVSNRNIRADAYFSGTTIYLSPYYIDFNFR